MKMTSTKRFAVRTALVTSTTLATILGAQALASLDETARAQPAPPPVVAPAETTAAAPNIVILRHASAPELSFKTQAPAQPSSSNTVAVQIQPPNPVQVAPPQPVVQQQAAAAQPAPSAPVTRSSR